MGTPDTDILVIAGDAPTADVLCDILSYAEYSTRVSHDCAAACMAVEARVPNLIVFDLGLPPHWLSTLTQLRQRLPCIPIIVMSTNPKPPAEALLSATAIIVKPFELDELLVCVAQSLSIAHN